MTMFCRPPEPPERDPADRYADTRGELFAGEPASPTARALTAAMLQLGGWRQNERPCRPASTEGGQGRAEPGRRLGDDLPSTAWRLLKATPEGGGLDDVLRGFRAPDHANRLTRRPDRT